MGSEPLLEFEEVSTVHGRGAERSLESVTLQLGAGELALIEVPRAVAPPPVADLACGLVRPSRGCVRFLGRDWRKLPPREAARLRFSIGRVFEESEWVSNLNVDENVLLASCHHTRRPEAEILARAVALIEPFGLEDLASLRPHLLAEVDRRVHALVRAFLPQPRLLILERPLRGLHAEQVEALVGLIHERLAAGAGLLWLGEDSNLLARAGLDWDHHFRVRPPRLEPIEDRTA